jgi:hypothetical protein
MKFMNRVIDRDGLFRYNFLEGGIDPAVDHNTVDIGEDIWVKYC